MVLLYDQQVLVPAAVHVSQECAHQIQNVPAVLLLVHLDDYVQLGHHTDELLIRLLLAGFLLFPSERAPAWRRFRLAAIQILVHLLHQVFGHYALTVLLRVRPGVGKLRKQQEQRAPAVLGHGLIHTVQRARGANDQVAIARHALELLCAMATQLGLPHTVLCIAGLRCALPAAARNDNCLRVDILIIESRD